MLKKVILVQIGYSSYCIFECFTAFTSTDLIKQNNQTNSEIFFCFTWSVLVQADPKGILIQLNSLITYQGHGYKAHSVPLCTGKVYILTALL